MIWTKSINLQFSSAVKQRSIWLFAGHLSKGFAFVYLFILYDKTLEFLCLTLPGKTSELLFGWVILSFIKQVLISICFLMTFNYREASPRWRISPLLRYTCSSFKRTPHQNNSCATVTHAETPSVAERQIGDGRWRTWIKFKAATRYKRKRMKCFQVFHSYKLYIMTFVTHGLIEPLCSA